MGFRRIKPNKKPLTQRQFDKIVGLKKPQVPTGFLSRLKFEKWITKRISLFMAENDLMKVIRKVEKSLWDGKEYTITQNKPKVVIEYCLVIYDERTELVIRFKKSHNKLLNELLETYQSTLATVLLSKAKPLKPNDKLDYIIYSFIYHTPDRKIRIQIAGNGEEIPFDDVED